MIKHLWDKYWDLVERKHLKNPIYGVLKRELNTVGKEFEQMPYEKLLQPAEVLSFSRVVDGVKLTFSAEAYHVKKNGDIGFCIDGDAEGLTGWRPSYQFVKRKDGSIKY